MKILFCTNSFEQVSNGPAKFANLLLDINQQPSLDCTVKILTEDISTSKKDVFKLHLKYPRFLKLFSQLFRIFAYHRAARKIKKEYEFDLIIYNNAFIGLLSAIIFPYTIGMINDDNNLSRRMKDWKFEKVFIKQFIFKQLEYISTRFFTKTIVNSYFLKDLIIKEYKVPDGKVCLLYKGCEIIPSRPYQDIDKQSIVKVLFVKADYLRGGLKELIFALGSLPFKFSLSVIGTPEHANQKIDNWAKNHNNVHLHLLGIQPQAKVKEVLRKSDLFCVPSHKEALGVANLEAITLGVPVVSTNVGGIPEILDYGKAGWLAEAKNPQDLASKIHECILDEEKRKQRTKHGIKHSQKFSQEITLENFMTIARASPSTSLF